MWISDIKASHSWSVTAIKWLSAKRYLNQKPIFSSGQEGGNGIRYHYQVGLENRLTYGFSYN
jgi:hypothetical protein